VQTSVLDNLGLMLAAEPAQGGTAHAIAGVVQQAVAGPQWLLAVPLLPLIAAILAGLCRALGVKNKMPAWFVVASLAASFVVTLVGFLGWQNAGGPAQVIHLYDWIRLSWGDQPGQTLVAPFSLYMDGVSYLWMLFVTGLATLIALYASEYMSHDVGAGYSRFFGAFGLFVFSMACLVMGDNLVLLYLGWEGVGLCSYLLIGYYYKKPAAVAAAKKAFIMNRIGDLGLALGLFLTFVKFGTVQYDEIFRLIQAGTDGSGTPLDGQWTTWAIPCLLTLGAFGKSAQLFFYVWLPDAMEGPTPVSALIHAATMVTAGVYLVARLYPIYLADDMHIALAIVAWGGAITAIWAATIEMAIFDIKRVMGYSTVSQLGFMFAGLGVLTPIGATFHTFTHAFFKATLFLGVGAVMHGFGGQLDLRRLSGVMWMKGFGLIGIAMLIGSINLAGVPGTAGYFSKDLILAQGFTTPSSLVPGATAIGWILLITAGMTAYYTFRTFFRVYVGPKEFVPGDDAELIDLGRHPKGTTLDEWHAQHGHGHGHGHDDHGHGHGHGAHGHTSTADIRAHGRHDFDPTTEEFDPHPPGWAMKTSVAICAVLAVLAAGLYFVKPSIPDAHGGWVAGMVHHSSANAHGPHEGFNFLGITNHSAMYVISAVVGFAGILIAAFLHGPRGIGGLFIGNRTRAEVSRADALVPLLGPIVTWARNKWYVDEIYHAIIVMPLWVLSNIFHVIDKLLVDGLVNGAGKLPGALARAIRPSQSGILQSYAVGMAGGLAVILVIVLIVLGAGA
jgi:NADH-quinone oxidoreductase subunit L